VTLMQTAITTTKTKVTHVIIGGVVFPWAAKAPYTPSGYSTLGALEFNQKEDLVRCHMCGDWFKSIGCHVRQSEGISAAEYRRNHGLRSVTSLNVPSTHIKFVRQGRAQTKRKSLKPGQRLPQKRIKENPGCAEMLNLRMRCQAQIRQRIMLTAFAVDGTPSAADLKKYQGLDHKSIKQALGTSLSQTMISLGLTPNLVGGANKHARRDNGTLGGFIREPLPSGIKKQRQAYTA